MPEYLPIIRDLSPRQLEVLSAIAIGEDTGHHAQTLSALEKKGLIERYQERLMDLERFPVLINRYRMPLAVHLAWATWGSEAVARERGRGAGG